MTIDICHPLLTHLSNDYHPHTLVEHNTIEHTPSALIREIWSAVFQPR